MRGTDNVVVPAATGVNCAVAVLLPALKVTGEGIVPFEGSLLLILTDSDCPYVPGAKGCGAANELPAAFLS